MLINYQVQGFKTFNELVTFSMAANQKIKNDSQVFNLNKNKILKSAIIYGPNNTGKSSFIESISLLKEIINLGKITENAENPFYYNFFSDYKFIFYNIEFLQNNNKYIYSLKFSFEKILSEKLIVNDKLIFDRYKLSKDKDINQLLNIVENYQDQLIATMLPNKFINYSLDIKKFFDNITILNSSFLNFKKVVGDISKLSSKDLNKFVNIIKSADLSIADLTINNKFNDDELKLFSYYQMNNKREAIPSYIGDSTGTKVFMAYILNIQKCLSTGGILIIDEIDKSLHTLLTKNIIMLFNNEENKNSQLICTSHDLLLLDCDYLFRKDQVWFTYKDSNKVYLNSLNNYKANGDNAIRNKTMSSYLKGLFGALPHPSIEDYIYDNK